MMKIKPVKILIAGVGGQGIVYLTNIIVEAAMHSGVPVSVSEIHGLSQRGGVVTSGIGLGEHCSGFIGNASVDYLIGLEPLETQRCLQYLHTNSKVIFGPQQIAPYAVNAELAKYPDPGVLYAYLESHCREVIYINEFPKDVESVLGNIFLLGRATCLSDFPLKADHIEIAIQDVVPEYSREKSCAVFRRGIASGVKKEPA